MIKKYDLPHSHGNESLAGELKEQLDNSSSFLSAADVFKQLADMNRVRIFWLLCHCEECVVNISALVGMTSPAVSHHLRILKSSGLIVSRREGKEVYYKSSDSEQSRLLHEMIEKTIEMSCVKTGSGYAAQQAETIKQVHDFLTENLDKRYTIEELSKRFLMNPSTLKAAFKAVYGNSLAAHIKEHRMELAAERLLNTDASIAEIAAGVGYESQSKFSAEFKKVYQMLPTEYRRLRR